MGVCGSLCLCGVPVLVWVYESLYLCWVVSGAVCMFVVCDMMRGRECVAVGGNRKAEVGPGVGGKFEGVWSQRVDGPLHGAELEGALASVVPS